MHVSAKADYAVRAAVELARAPEGPVTAETLARAQCIPRQWLETILRDLRRAGVVRSQRGPAGGHWLARPPEEVTVADVMRAVDGPLASVRGDRPENLAYEGLAVPLQQVWIALRANLRAVLEVVTLADIADDRLPAPVLELAADPEAWTTR
ncbi:RrF2 family transcriptional regulator [Kineococcus sp. NUM-3379]